MKRFAIALGVLLLSPSAMAKEPWELDIPSLEEQWEKAQLEKLDEIVREAEGDPDYAGTVFQVNWKGELYKAVDRRAEPARKPPGQTPARSAALAALINGLSSDARSQVQVQLKVTYNKDGTIASEDWTLNFAASWQAQTGMGEANDKSHK